MSTAGVVARPTLNPFPGLRPFCEEEARLFFGRDEQVTTLLHRLEHTRFLAVLGTSGSGKSSLVHAGLLPILRSGFTLRGRSSWRIAVMRPGKEPLLTLEEAVADTDVLGPHEWMHSTLTASSHGLVEATRRAALDEDEGLLLVVDQFEELFRFPRDNARRLELAATFVNLLLEAVAQEPRIWVVLTMRSDFLGECAQLRGLPEALNGNQFLVPRMTRDELREAIEGPLVTRLVHVEPALVERLLNDAGDDPDHLPLIQHALMRLWDDWARERTGPIGLRHYENIGTIDEALRKHATEVSFELQFAIPPAKPIDALTLKRVFQRLTDRRAGSQDTRRPCPAQELAGVAGVDLATIGAIFAAFSAEGRTFLFSDDRPLRPDSVVDITHESLIRLWFQLDAWMREEVDAATEFWRVSSAARMRASPLGRPQRAELWHGEDLGRARAWEDRLREGLGVDWRPAARAWATRYSNDPTDLDNALDFLDQSRRAERDRIRLKRLGMLTILAIGVGFAGLFYWAWGQKRRADEATAYVAVSAAVAREAELKATNTLRELEARTKGADAERARADGKTEEADRLAREALDARAQVTRTEQDLNDQRREVNNLKQVAQAGQTTALSQALAQIDSFRSRLAEIEQQNRELQGEIDALNSAALDGSDKPDPIRRKALDDLARATVELGALRQATPEVFVLSEESPYQLKSPVFRGRAWVYAADIEPDRVDLRVVWFSQAGADPSLVKSTARDQPPRILGGEADQADFKGPDVSLRLVVAKVDDRFGPSSDTITLVAFRIFQ
jgi:cell division septum initiation protein DivIVA